jgi:hypothetical protein
MAIEEHLAILKQGVEAWNRWRKYNPEVIPDLAEANFDKRLFVGTELYRIDILGVNLPGVNFVDANLFGSHLVGANLTQANLTGANLSQANLDQAKLLESKLSRTQLTQANLFRTLLVRADLQAADLSGAELSGAELIQANLIATKFIGANLTGAGLTAVQAIFTNFEKAILTGVCLEDWHTNSETNLDGVICEYVYLKNAQQERRPSSGNFAPGEFTKLFQKARETVDLIFRNGIDWQAVLISLQQLRVENDSKELYIQAVENKNDGAFVIRVNVPPNADKAKIEQFFKQKYTKALKSLDEKYRYQLQAKDEQIATYRQTSADTMELAKLMATRPIANTAIAMSESTDQSRNINISGGTVNNTGAAAMSLGDISGTVANTINQLPASSESDKPGIKELLEQLQKAIEAEPNLSEEDKAEALEQVKALAEAGKAPQEGAMQKIAKRSTTMLKGIVAGLPEAAKLAVEYAKLLPMITSLFGLG